MNTYFFAEHVLNELIEFIAVKQWVVNRWIRLEEPEGTYRPSLFIYLQRLETFGPFQGLIECIGVPL